MSWCFSFSELSIQKPLWSTIIGHSGNIACPSHLVPFKTILNGLHFCSLQCYFVGYLVEPLHAKQATKTAHMELVQLFHMSEVNYPGFAGIEKH